MLARQLIDRDLDRTLDEIARSLVFATTQSHPSLGDVARWDDIASLGDDIEASLGDAAGDVDVDVINLPY